MSAEYQRLEAEASQVQNQIDELVKSCGQMVLAADFQKFEAKNRRAAAMARRTSASNGQTNRSEVASMALHQILLSTRHTHVTTLTT